MQIHTYVHTRTHTHLYVHMHTPTHSHPNPNPHPYTHMYIHTYIHTYICTYMHKLALLCTCHTAHTDENIGDAIMIILYKPRWNTVSWFDDSVDMYSIYIPHKYYWEVCNAYTHESGVHKGSPIVQCTVGVCNEEQEQHASKRVCGCVSCNHCSHKITKQDCSQGHLSLCLFLTATLLSSAKTASSTSGDLLIMPNI